MERRETKYLNPYLAGFLLGLTLLAAMYFSGRGLGASGTPKRIIAAVSHSIMPETTENAKAFASYFQDGQSPLSDWLVFEVLGMIIGAFISGVLAGRLTWRVEHSPKITSRKRLWMALIGGALFGIGSQFGRGCTSGAALSGMASFATSGFIAVAFIFGTGYAVAWFFRKNWI